jgi:hypothetical protein
MFRNVPFRSFIRRNKTLSAILVAGLIIHLLFIFTEIEHFITYQKDDAYFYYTIARNVAQDNGITIANGIETNGLHPLYLFVLIPIYIVFYPFGINVPIYIISIIFAFIHVLTGVFLFAIAKHISNKTGGLLSVTLWMLNPYITSIYLNGMETPIQIFVLSILTFYLINKREKNSLSSKNILVIGVLLGLLFLSRMDMAFVAIGLAISLLLRGPSKSLLRTGRVYINRSINIIILSVISLTLTIPWFIYTFTSLGRFTPISGEARKIISSDNTLGSTSGSIQTLLKFVDGSVSSLLSINYQRDLLISVFTAIIVIFVLIFPIIYLIINCRKKFFTVIKSLDFLLFASALYYPYYIVYLGHSRHYYNLYTALITILIFSTSLGICIERTPSDRFKIIAKRTIACIIIMNLLFGFIPLYLQGGTNAGMETNMDVATNIDKHVPENASITSYHNGVSQYYTPNRDVILLDPYINPQTINHYRKNNMFCYIEKEQFDYIIGSASVLNGSEETQYWHDNHRQILIKKWDKKLKPPIHPLVETRSNIISQQKIHKIKHNHRYSNTMKYCS